MPCLVIHLRGTHQVVEVGASCTIGRHPTNDLQIMAHRVSKFHCVVERRGERFMLVDRSLNGTTINGALVEVAELHHGDVVGVGPVRLRFADVDPRSTDEAQLAELASGLEQVVVVPERGTDDGKGGGKEEFSSNYERLRKFSNACRSMLASEDVATLMHVLLAATEDIAGATGGRVKLRHSSGAITEKTLGEMSPPSVAPASDWPASSGVMRVTPRGEGCSTELALPIRGRGGVDGALWLRMEGPMGHRDHDAVTTLCDLMGALLASLAHG